MDNTTRLQYLEAMGIESWELRQLSPVPTLPIMPDLTDFKNLEGLNTTVLPMPETVVIQEMPKSVDTWEILQNEVIHCRKCELCHTRTQTVFGTGNQQPDWLFIGEAPGEQEDLQGQPFVGAAGLLLTEMIRAMGLTREQIFIANILKCRPPNNRDPKVDEMSACSPFLERQIALLNPKIIVAVGRISAHKLLNTNETLAKLRGHVYPLNGIPLIVIYHPAYLLRSLSQKRKVWQDLQLALKTYQKTIGA